MAAGGFIDMTKFTFEGKLVDSLSEMLFEDTLRAPDFTSIHTIFPGIVTNTEVGFIGEGGLVGVPDTGCNSSNQEWSINTRKLEWNPKTWEIFLKQCYTDLQNAATIYSLHTGVRIPDFTDTDYANIVLTVLRKSVRDFFYRTVWFGNTSAQSAPTGTVTAGLDTKYFTLLDGFWKQAITQAGENAKQRVTITENTGASHTAQKVSPENIVDYFAGLVYGAPIELRGMENQFILVTQSIYDAYTQYLASSQYLESARVMLLDGRSALSYDGIPVIAMPIWDKMIKSYFDNGTKYDNPNRAIYTARPVLGVGVDSLDSFDQIEMWYDRKDKVVFTRLMGRLDAKLTNPEMFTIAI